MCCVALEPVSEDLQMQSRTRPSKGTYSLCILDTEGVNIEQFLWRVRNWVSGTSDCNMWSLSIFENMVSAATNAVSNFLCHPVFEILWAVQMFLWKSPLGYRLHVLQMFLLPHKDAAENQAGKSTVKIFKLSRVSPASRWVSNAVILILENSIHPNVDVRNILQSSLFGLFVKNISFLLFPARNSIWSANNDEGTELCTKAPSARKFEFTGMNLPLFSLHPLHSRMDGWISHRENPI